MVYHDWEGKFSEKVDKDMMMMMMRGNEPR